MHALRWSTVSFAVALGLLVSACSNSSGPSPVSPSASESSSIAKQETSAPAARPLSATQLTSALLTVHDLPAGWVKQSEGKSLVLLATALCGERLAGAGQVTAPTSTGLQSAPKAGLIVGESLGSFATAGAAQSVVATAQHAATTCTSFTAGGSRLSIAPLAVPTVGDYSFAVRLRHRTTSTDVVIAEVGSTVLLLTAGGNGPDRPAVVTQLAKLAARRVSAI
jgi:hypothetical protein